MCRNSNTKQIIANNTGSSYCHFKSISNRIAPIRQCPSSIQRLLHGFWPHCASQKTLWLRMVPSDTFRPPCSGVYCTAITAIVQYVRCTLISWVEHNICLSTHSNNELSQRHKRRKASFSSRCKGNVGQ